MMPTLSNILLTDGAQPSDVNEAPTSSGKTKESKGDDKSFASLMNLASSSPSFSQSNKTKTEKAGHAESPKHQHKADVAGTDDHPLVGITPDLMLNPNTVLAVSQNSFVPPPVSTAPVAGNQSKLAVASELTAKTMPDVLAVGLKTKPAGQSAGVLAMAVESKKASQSVISENSNDVIPTVSGKVIGNPPDSSDVVKPMEASKIKTDDIGKPASSEKITSEKIAVSDKTIIPPDAKTISPSPAPVQIAVLQAQMVGVVKSDLKPSDQSPVKQADSVTVNSKGKAAATSKEVAAVSKQPPELDSKITVSQMPTLPASKVESKAEGAVIPPSDADGTSIAKEDVAMKKSDKLNKFAGAAEKILPGNATVVRDGALSTRADQPILNSATGSSLSNSIAADPSLSANLVAGSSGIDDRSRTLDRTQEMVVQHALRLNGASGDTLQVVIKPGGGTQLSLELRQHGGGVEVQATLQHGDFSHLNQNWPELQQRLEQRGIRLAALVGDGSFAASQGGNSFQQKHSQPAEAIGEFVPAVSASGTFVSPATEAVTRRGWETWA